ncbi:uncharacterized protein B0J16DRAFT_374134 [Fusarium flagelliforme]|uniref:uncharacterized protein n=1 Tax=Fusarium flagelliforme TaxID=2675880 RepID=UPI001E8E6EE9|nr:uncharacterized protein B0J16DRAFT_374134 [Fusarium flagelliforme]KAH7179001.1 hypothetical protein B0J16DRAFT_374134 [Fusarium flagelliforme]
MAPSDRHEAITTDIPPEGEKDYTWLYTWIRPKAAVTSTQPASPDTSTSLPSTTVQTRDLSQLEASIPAKKCYDLKLELSNQNHAFWATIAPSIICVICLEEFSDADEVRHLACEHIFHSVCISGWYLAQHDTCPICNCDFVQALQKPCEAHL